MSASCCPGIMVGELSWRFCCHWSHYCCCRFVPGTSLTGSRLPSRSWDFWLLQIPGLHTSLSQRHPVSTCHHCSVSPLCCMDIAIQATTGELAHQVWGGRYHPWMFCTCLTPSPMDHPRRSGLISASAETLKIVNSFPGHCWKSCAQGRVSGWVGCSSSQVFCYSPEVTVWSMGISPPPGLGCTGTAQATEWVGTTTEWS